MGNGTSAGVGEALSPLVGVWAPTFSACELAAVFLLPFVAIRLVAGDRQSGALKLELQRGMSPFARIAAKAAILLAGWMVAMLPPLSDILLWTSYGGSVYAPELATLTLGHVLNAGLTIALAAAMATGHRAHRAGADSAGLGFAAVWMRLSAAASRRVYDSIGLGLLAAAAIFACAFCPVSWDTSVDAGRGEGAACCVYARSVRKPAAATIAAIARCGLQPPGAPRMVRIVAWRC
jgi:hypothetical protein